MLNILLFLFSLSILHSQKIEGEPKKGPKIINSSEEPQMTENGTENTFQSTSSANDKQGIVLDGLKDFEINPINAKSTYYKDEKNGALAINAAQKELRDKYAVAYTIFTGKSGAYHMSLVTMGENDGESSYVVKLNGAVIDSLTNPQTEATYNLENHNLGLQFLEPNDVLQIESKAVTNGLIPENDETAWSRGRWNKLILNPSGLSMEGQLENAVAFEEKDGLVEVEAEGYHYNSGNGTERHWYIRPKNNNIPEANSLTDHSEGAGNRLYIEALPDTRVTHDDKLIKGGNFFPDPGTGGIVSYKVNFTAPGKYHVWVRAYSSGSEDNGVHVGIDNQWPESGARMQWCEGKHQWTWSAAQRTEEVHCGVPQAIYLDVKTPGEHIISFSMREDGFEMDKWLMTRDHSYQPE